MASLFYLAYCPVVRCLCHTLTGQLTADPTTAGRTTASESWLADEKAQLSSIAVALRDMSRWYAACVDYYKHGISLEENNCEKYEGSSLSAQNHADHAEKDADKVEPEHVASFRALKEDFIANAIGTLDLMHAECKTSKQCAPTAEYASKVDEFVTLYHDKLETVQPAVLEDSQLANLLQRRHAGREQGAESLLQAVFWTKSPPSLTDDQKSKSKREIVFDGADSWDIYDCGWSSGEPAESLYPSDGSLLTDSDCGGKLGTITCPCTSPTLDPQDKSGWPAAVAVILSDSLANINFPVSSVLAILVKAHKTELVTTMLNDCVAAVCDRTTHLPHLIVAGPCECCVHVCV